MTPHATRGMKNILPRLNYLDIDVDNDIPSFCTSSYVSLFAYKTYDLSFCRQIRVNEVLMTPMNAIMAFNLSMSLM